MGFSEKDLKAGLATANVAMLDADDADVLLATGVRYDRKSFDWLQPRGMKNFSVISNREVRLRTVARWYPKTPDFPSGVIVDFFVNDDAQMPATEMNRGEVFRAIAAFRLAECTKRGIGYLVRWSGTPLTREDVEAAKVRVAGPGSTLPDTAAREYESRYGDSVDIDNIESTLADNPSGVAAVRRQL